MTFELTEVEHVAIIHLVEERLRMLKPEIRHTATHEFKIVLKDHELVLETLLDKLKAKEAVF